MRKLAVIVLVFCVRVLLGADFRVGEHVFTLGDDFELEQVAAPPLVDRPIVADFDELGRLYVADSSGSNDKVEKQLEEKPHRIVRLEDTDEDGFFDKSTVFADKMMFPEGAMWFDGSLYVSAPPSIWKLTDTDGNGVADKREEWFQGKTLTGCANDLHGPYRGLDGWIYWCKGAFAQQSHDLPNNKKLVTRAAHIFRARPDGSGLEPVMTGGMDNPVDVIFTPTGDLIFTTTFFQHPGEGKRDGLVHAIYGGVYGKTHDVIESHTRTGDVMPILTHMGPAAPCGLALYESDRFGMEYRNNLFACQFNLRKVSRHILQPKGSSFVTVDEDFLVSDKTDFHPTDVIEDADGSLLVIDTGGWYKLCCPTSQLYKPDVLGSIYRIRRRGAPPVKDPRGLKLKWQGVKPEQLVVHLDDTRPAVRRRAMETLASFGPASLPALKRALEKGSTAETRRNAAWALTRIDHEDAREAIRRGIVDRDESVRQAAVFSAGLRRDSTSISAMTDAALYGSPHLQRAIATSMAQIGSASAMDWLLNAASKPHDRPLEHAIIYALIQVGDAERTRSLLFPEKSSSARRAGLIALDQMGDGKLSAEDVVPLLSSEDTVVRETAIWITGRRPSWGGHLKVWFEKGLAEVDSRTNKALISLLAQFARNQSVRELLGNQLSSVNGREAALQAMARSGLREMPDTWGNELRTLLKQQDTSLLERAVQVIQSVPAAKSNGVDLTEQLIEVAEQESLPEKLRIQALAAIPKPKFTLRSNLFQLTLSALTNVTSARGDAASVLTKANLQEEQLQQLAGNLPSVSPLELSRILPAFDQQPSEAVGMKLVAALDTGKTLTSLRPDLLQARFAKYPSSVREKAQPLIARMDVDTGKQQKRLEELLGVVKDGDIRRGQGIFNSAKAACVTCHTIGYVGGNLGPDLTRIGQVRTERDLLESIVFPSASFVRSYESVAAETSSGEIHTGILKKESAEEVVIATGAGIEQRIARKDLAQIRPGTISVMPQGLDEQLTKQELADLVAFLKASK